MPETTTARKFSDPIGFEVFRNAVYGLANEMALVMMRTAHSVIAHSALDFSTSLCDARGRVIAQGNTILLHLGTISDVVQELARRYAGRIEPGDTFLLNAEPAIGQHLPDVYALRPCFREDRLFGFSVCMSHHADVGGAVPGSMAPASTEIFQEGLQIPLVKLYEGGRLNEGLRLVLTQNVRRPDLFWGDLQGQLAACSRGEAGLAALAEQHGIEGLEALIDELFAYTERCTRAAIGRIPAGEYRFEDWLDDDYTGSGAVPIRVALRIQPDEVVADWSGSSPQVKSAANNPYTNTQAITYGALRSVLGDLPINHGFYRPIRVIAKEGTIVNPKWPAARAVRGLTAARMMDTILGALAQALPDRVPAAGAGGNCPVMFAGTAETGEPFFTPSPSGWSAWGARPGRDGIEGASSLTGNVAFFPVEDVEATHGLRVERHEFLPDSGGPGRWRGGLSVVTDMRFIGTEGVAMLRYGRRDIPPYGLAGGYPGNRAAILLNPGSDEYGTGKALSVNARVPLKRGDVIRQVTPGGGGYGDPKLRSRDAVFADLREGKVSPEVATEIYGLTGDNMRAR